MDLDEFRSRINALDEQILKLLNQRAEAALRIGELKRRQDLPYFVPEREAEIVRRLLSLNPGPFPAEGIKAVWREILSASLALEHPLSVASFITSSRSFRMALWLTALTPTRRPRRTSSQIIRAPVKVFPAPGGP